jgi:hypothetical protein
MCLGVGTSDRKLKYWWSLSFFLINKMPPDTRFLVWTSYQNRSKKLLHLKSRLKIRKSCSFSEFVLTWEKTTSVTES